MEWLDHDFWLRVKTGPVIDLVRGTTWKSIQHKAREAQGGE